LCQWKFIAINISRLENYWCFDSHPLVPSINIHTDCFNEMQWKNENNSSCHDNVHCCSIINFMNIFFISRWEFFFTVRGSSKFFWIQFNLKFRSRISLAQSMSSMTNKMRWTFWNFIFFLCFYNFMLWISIKFVLIRVKKKLFFSSCFKQSL